MSIQPATPALPRPRLHADGPAGAFARAAIAVDTVGYRVPRMEFDGRVHSTFARACNIACGDVLLTLVDRDAGNGPTLLRIAAGARDLRRMFDVDEPVRCARGILRGARTDIQLAHARVWRPAAHAARVTPAQIENHLRRAAADLAMQRRRRASAIDRAAAPVVAALRDACRRLDDRGAAEHAERLIGWGEGLTPAGDDFLIGVCAGLDALIDGDAARQACRDSIGAAMCTASGRTTTISAHYLRLAAGGHYQERLLDARDALLCDASPQRRDVALRTACTVGASSGTDSVAGLLAALTAWMPVPATTAVV